MNAREKFIRYYMPAVVWAALIFVASSVPGRSIPPTPTGTDKLVHAGIYFVLSWLLFRVFIIQRSVLVTQMSVFLAVVVTILYGVSDEFHQLYVPGRTADMYDVAADATGGLVFVAVYLFMKWRRNTHSGQSGGRS